MSKPSKDDFYSIQDEGEQNLNQTNNSQRPKNKTIPSSQSNQEESISKSLLDQFLSKIDIILAVILIVFLIFFFLQTQDNDSKKIVKTITIEQLKPKSNTTNNQKQVVQVEPKQNLQNKEKDKLKTNKYDWLDQEDTEQDKQTKKQQEQSSEDSQFKKDPKADLAKKKLEEKYLMHARRNQFFKGKEKTQNLEYLRYAKYNLQYPDMDKDQKQIFFQYEKEQLQEKYKIHSYPEQLSICAVVYSGDHKKQYSHEYVLNSIINQDYQNFIVVYIADGYTGQQIQPVKAYIKEIDKDKKVTLVWNEGDKKFFLESTVTAIKTYCMKKKVTVLVDGDDQLLGRQVFKVLNSRYREKNVNLVYGNFIEYHYNEQQLRIGFSNEYEDVQKKENKYRLVGQKFGSLKSFKTRLISFIQTKDLKDGFGNYYRFAGDYALMYPLLELSCGQISYLPEFTYLYYGYEIDPVFGNIQITTGRQIRQKERYQCFKNYK